MSTVQTWCLLFWAVVGWCLVVFSPIRKSNAEMQGLTPSEAAERIKQARANEETPGTGCRRIAGGLLEVIQTALVEPGYLLWALLNHIGSRQIALIDLSIVVGNVVISVLVVAVSKQVRFPKMTWWYWVKVFVFSLPSLYLWYLFLVIIGVMR